VNSISNIHSSWRPILGLLQLEPLSTLRDEILPNCSYNPLRDQIFRVFEKPVTDIKVVILEQNPYPNPKYACGYAFAVPQDVDRKPKSLTIIEKEVIDSDPSNVNSSGNIDLLSWVDQGVLLLNTALTIERGKPGSHDEYWKHFIERVIKFIATNNPSIWLLWGRHSQKFLSNIPKHYSTLKYDRGVIDQIPIDPTFNYVMTSSHPMVEVYKSNKFYGCDHFYKVNRILSQKRLQKIKW